jgi:hypothetical protein
MDGILESETNAMTAARGVRGRLLSRLQARHDCAQPDGGGFEQVEPEYGVKRWRCLGCNLIVTLD